MAFPHSDHEARLDGPMNKRRREILNALQPAALIAMQRTKPRPVADVPGLAMRARPSAEAPAEILIYGRIGGGGWFMDGISAADVAALLREAGPGPVNVRINSGGGDVFDGVAIHSLLARHAGTVVTYVDGLAASAASFIMLAGSRVVAARNSFVMIHDAMTYTYGNGDTHRSAGDLLDKVSDNIADMYAEKAGEDPPYWRNVMTEHGEDGTWYTGQEAMDAGLVDEITGTEDDDDETNALLSGWVDLLPATISANLKLPPEPTDQETTARWDPSKLTEILKGVLA
jgi:ATP-dependent protease ClpP protease subunit